MPINAGSIYSEVRLALDKLKADIVSAETALDKFGNTNKKKSEETKKSWQDSFKSINLAAVAAFAGLTLAVKASVEIFAKFEQSLANVRSVAQATPAEFKKIEEAAISAGERTRFTASQAADAMYYLASAGFSATQSVEALDGVLLLAGATGSDLAQTSATVASTIAQFGLEAKDAGDVANVLTAAITNSQATMDKLAVSMRYVGPVASAMGKTLEETAGALQILYNNGFEASQAGTALRSTLADLSNETSPAIARLKQLGVSFEEVNPQTNSFADILQVLNERVTDGGDIMQIFGDRAGPAMIKLIQGGRAEIEKYTEAVTGTNAAAEAYAIQNDTLQGSLDFLKSAIESAQIKFVKEFTPAMRAVVDAITRLVKIFTELPGPIKIFIGIVAVGIPVVLGLMQAFKMLQTLMTATNGVIGLVILGVAALVAIMIALQQSMDTLTQLTDATDTLVKSNEELDKINKELTKSTKDMNEAERETLEQRKKQAEQNVAASLAGQVAAIKRAIDSQKELNKALAANVDIQKKTQAGEFITTTTVQQMKIEPTAANQAGITGRGAFQTELDYLGQLADGYASGIKQRDKYNDAIEEGKNTIARYVIAGNISIEQIYKLDKALGIEIATRAKNMETIEAQAALRKKAEAEAAAVEEEAAKRRIAASSAYKLAIGEVNSVIEDQKGAYTKLQEQLTRFEELKFKSTEDEKKRLEAINILKYKIAEEDRKRNKEATKYIEDYAKKLDELTKSEEELLEIEHQRALEAIIGSAADDDAKQKAIEAVDEFYEKLKDKTATDQFQENIKNMFATVYSGFLGLGDSINTLTKAMTSQRLQALDEQLAAELSAAGLREKTEIERLQSELDAAKIAGNAALVATKQKELQKAQIVEAFEKKKAQIRYESELSIWRITLAQTIAQSAAAIVTAVAAAPWPFNIPGIAFATVIGAAQTAAVALSAPPPPRFKTGGIVLGDSSQTDSVRALVTPGEMILNEDQQKNLFNQLNQSGGSSGQGGTFTLQLYQDGLKTAEQTVDYINNGVVRLKL